MKAITRLRNLITAGFIGLDKDSESKVIHDLNKVITVVQKLNDTLEELSPEVLAFAKTMQLKLDENKHKENSWKDCKVWWLYRRLQEEVIELGGADTLEDTKKECADVANFAMMMHANSKE